MRLQLSSSGPPPRIKGKLITDELAEIAIALGPEERESLMKTLDDGVSAPPQKGCTAFMQLMGAGVQLPAERRDPFLRGFTFSSLVDW